MSETIFFSPTDDRQRIRQLKIHINQLLTELRSIENHVEQKPFHLTIQTDFTHLSTEEVPSCPFVTLKRKSTRLHSTANHEHRRKSKKISPSTLGFAATACATSTPKMSSQNKRLPQTSTPRHSLHDIGNPLIPLKRLLYHQDTEHRNQKRRHSAVPFTKRSMLPRLQRIEENPQWI